MTMPVVRWSEFDRVAVSLVALCAVLTFGAVTASAQSWPSVGSSPEGLGDGTKDAAVLVGIDDYAFVPDVPGAAANVLDWYSFLRQSYGVPSTKIVLLQNEQGTRENIVAAIEKASKMAKPGGNLWFVFVGHGAASKDGKDGVLIGADTQGSATSIYARSLPRRELVKLTGANKKVRPILVIDACFSGQTASGASLVDGLQPLIPVNDQAAEAPGRGLVFSAGTSDQFAGSLPGADRPAFSYLLLGALQGWGDGNGDGQVSASEAVEYARDVLATKVHGRAQTPEVSGDQTHAVLTQGKLAVAPDLDQNIATGPTVTTTRAGHVIRILSDDLPTLDIQMSAADGRSFRCRSETASFDPCSLQGVPEGAARIKVGAGGEISDLQVTGDLNLRAEENVWTWTTIAGVSILSVGALTFLGGLVPMSDDPATDSFWIDNRDEEFWKEPYQEALRDYEDEQALQQNLKIAGGLMAAAGLGLTVYGWMHPDIVLVRHKGGAGQAQNEGRSPSSPWLAPSLAPTEGGAVGGLSGRF